MNYTDNYKLNLPSFNDSADISALNENFSKIDRKLKENEKAIGNVKVPTTDQTYKPTSANPQSGKAVAEAIAGVKFTTDTTVKEGSSNPVSGGAVYTALQNVSAYLASENLCDNQWEYGLISSKGIHYGDATNGYRSKNYLPVEGGQPIYQNNSTDTAYVIFQYDIDKNIISFGGLNQGAITKEGVLYDRKIELDANAKYIRVHKQITATSIDLSSVQVNILYKEDAEKIFNADGSFDYVEPYIYSKDILSEAKNNKTIIEHTYKSTSTNAISGKGVAEALKNVEIDVDTTVIEGSTNPVSGGAVYTALQNVKVNADSFISETSENSVQNKVIKQYVDTSIADLVAGGGISSDGRIQLKPNFANNTEECIDKSKVYVLPDGFIYAYMYSGAYPEITIEKITGQYFWYNGGNPKLYVTSSPVSTKRTNLIPVDEGDILKVTLRGTNGHTCNGCWYDENENMISPIMVEEPDQGIITTELTAPTGAKYVQLYSMNYNDNIDSVVLTIEWVYCAASLIPQWANTGLAFVPADYEAEILDHENRLKDLEGKTVESILKGKKIVYDGDSLCAPWGSENGGAYPQIIADLVGGSFDNQAVGGARIVTADGATDKNGNPVTLSHSVVDNIVNLPKDADLYCFECCVNDQFNMVTLGDYNPTEYSEERLNLNTREYCGALETIIRYALTNFVGKPICFIIPHKCKNQGDYGNGVTFADFRKKIIGLFEKYAIPYYDAWAESGLNNWDKTQLDNYFIIHGSNTTGDGTHPNEEGYKRYYVPQLISLFERIMPRGIEEESDTPSVEPDTPETPDEPEEPDTPTYTNVLDTVGYTKGKRISGSDGGLRDNTGNGTCVTGLIPIDPTNSVETMIYLKNVTMPDTDQNYYNQVACYDADEKFITGTCYPILSSITNRKVTFENGNLVKFKVGQSNVSYIRITALEINGDSIITVNEPIE